MSEGRLTYLEGRVTELEEREEQIKAMAWSALRSVLAGRVDRAQYVLEKLTILLEDE